MRALPILQSFKLLALTGLAVLVASCSSPSRTTTSTQAPKGGAVVRSMPGLDVNRAHKDGAPWWDVDVSRIPDATPTLHTGAYKANPYTVLGKTYFPMSDSKRYVASGTASWYGTKFHGQNTANGEVYDLYGMSAAHKTLPLPSYVKVTNLDNNRNPACQRPWPVLFGPHYRPVVCRRQKAGLRRNRHRPGQGRRHRPAGMVGAAWAVRRR